jgi:misacylated tRNA(Ala) deacylase
MKTARLYWQDDHCVTAEATVLSLAGQEVALDQTCFYPGGGGQPCDTGTLDGRPVIAVRADDDGVIWHRLEECAVLTAGQRVELLVDAARREALARYHTVLHILNTIVLRDYAGWITGAQIGVDYSRIDFNLERFTPEVREELERKVNAVIESNHPIRASWLTEAEFRERPDLLRTLDVKPPVHEGNVRVVAIEGFDQQACGGTHLESSGGLGRFSITKTENKGRQNKRLYVKLAPAGGGRENE